MKHAFRAALAVVLVAAAVSECREPGSPEIREARRAAAARGATFTDPTLVRGLREVAVCGQVAGGGAIYRAGSHRLLLAADFAPDTWDTLWQNWCGVSGAAVEDAQSGAGQGAAGAHPAGARRRP